MKKNIYISCPVTMSLSTLSTIVTRARDLSQQNITAWDRLRKYDPQIVFNCDTFVIVHPFNKFNFALNTLPSGCYNEIQKAIREGKKIVLAYKVSQGDYFFYKTDIRNGFLHGVGGSTGDFCSDLEASSDSWDYERKNTNPCDEIPLPPLPNHTEPVEYLPELLLLL
jgi:hypothetical protein